jgi:hypothetical protein
MLERVIGVFVGSRSISDALRRRRHPPDSGKRATVRSTLGAINAPTPPRVGTRISLERR